MDEKQAEVEHGRADRPKDPLSPLEVIDRLEVGPVRLEPKRLIAPYTVTQDGKTEATELIYRYEEPVFEPDSLSSQNLASMIAAQVALNYGLFCSEIVFRGPLDKKDQRFLKEMMQNTAREIFVIKLLRPNPFVRGPGSELPPVRKRDYVRAGLTFPDAATVQKDDAPAPDKRRHAILSSGGKDSLLTFGLLDEIGRETHPIFINESGRHWYTVLNAYRHFEATYPNTARVWTNSDRVFAWMLRHLPFVRQDFADVRSDEYPIRLWTVAVFLFGALPLLRKRGIGRLLIGDEYDTTQSSTHKGITHFNGYYDQSRFFDEALSRYYASKGWGIVQFSVLRPLSELLIEKVLAERYVSLLQHQTSCHATHKAGERMLPCGNCEKCRRIVGMLLAIGVDPKICGYDDDQIARCRDALGKRGDHQEKVGTEHLGFLLAEKGLLDGKLGTIKPRRRPEVTKLRFDSERAPPGGIPEDLREPLWRILLEHADGAVTRRGRAWVEVDPLTDAGILAEPYGFEKKRNAGPAERSENGYLLGELTWPQAKKRLANVDIALLPVGSIEQHGPHLPLDTDSYDADYLARAVAARCSDPKPLVMPLVSYGVAYHHQDFAGTISIGPDTLSRLVYEVGMSVARQGVTKLVIINGHGGNAPALKFAAQLINRDSHIFTTVDTGETSDADIAAMTQTPNDVHAGEVETSTALATRPELVDFAAATAFVPAFSSRYLDFTSKRSVEWYARTAKISPTGVMGDPTKATAEKGRHMWEVMISNLADFVEDLKGMTLEEIFQRRY